MPGPTIQEQDVSGYWAETYNPVTDFAWDGTFAWEDQNGVTIGVVVGMNDGSTWWDLDQDGWFDFGLRQNSEGDVEKYDGRRWRVEGDQAEEPLNSAAISLGSQGSDGWIL